MTERDSSDAPPMVQIIPWAELVSGELAVLDREFHKVSKQDRLEAYRTALMHLIVRCQALPGFDKGMLILNDLVLRLSEVLDGKPALRPVRGRRGRTGDSLPDENVQGIAVWGVDALIGFGFSEMSAIADVAKTLSDAKYKGRRGGYITARTVRDWRSRSQPVSNRNKPGVHAARQIAHSEFDEYVKLSPSKTEARKGILEIVAAALPKLENVRTNSDEQLI